jgi:hypothetical protein
VRLSVTRGASRGGVVLVVEVEERGTLVINELFPSTSAATAFWGGADISETNFFGRGINVGGGFVASTEPVVTGAHAGLGLRLRVAVPPIGGPYGLSLAVTGLFNDGSEFYRVSGGDEDPDPKNFIANRVRRAGGIVGVGKDFRSRIHVGLDFREEAVTATLPTSPSMMPIDFMINDGSSRVGSITASADLDTRSDPILPRSGMRIALSLEAASGLVGSSYDYVKTTVEGAFYRPLPRGHALGFHLFVGGIAGDAPYFDRFFIGDLNLLLPRRALGINFSTLPSATCSTRRSRTIATISTRRARWSNTRSRSGAGAASSTAVTRSWAWAWWGWPARATSSRPASRGWSSLPIDLTGEPRGLAWRILRLDLHERSRVANALTPHVVSDGAS